MWTYKQDNEELEKIVRPLRKHLECCHKQCSAYSASVNLWQLLREGKESKWTWGARFCPFGRQLYFWMLEDAKVLDVVSKLDKTEERKWWE